MNYPPYIKFSKITLVKKTVISQYWEHITDPSWYNLHQLTDFDFYVRTHIVINNRVYFVEHEKECDYFDNFDSRYVHDTKTIFNTKEERDLDLLQYIF